MKEIQSNFNGGFKYNVDHIRSISRMHEMGLPIDGLQEVQVTRRKVRKNFGKCVGFAFEKLGLNHLNEIVVPSVILSTEEVHNLIPTEGLNYMLGASLTGVSPLSSWFIALFEANYTPIAGVTAATFPAAATESTAYDETTRVAWVAGSISAASVSNTASKAVFTINATKTIYGIAQTSASAKSATTGVLVSVAKFASSKSVVDDDILNVTSTISMTST